MLKGRPAAGIDYTKWNEYQICKEFHWTPKQLREQLADDVELFLAFMHEERKAEKDKSNKRERRR